MHDHGAEALAMGRFSKALHFSDAFALSERYCLGQFRFDLLRKRAGHACAGDQCVESAIRDACDLGYLVTRATDACLTHSQE
ncbi:MAG: hypothetical protein ACREEP_12975, partial [Dongiaceae bacterium]